MTLATTTPSVPPSSPVVYEWRQLERRCPDCNLFTRRLGHGGRCPHCDEPVTLDELA